MERRGEEQGGWGQVVLELALIVAICYLMAGSPPPAVNEPHYLSKAKHYWNPAWCGGDFFLESADAHLVFFWTFGWVADLVSLPVAAWLGRVCVWLLFAASWRSLVHAIVPVRWASVMAAWLLLPLIQFGHLSGEWLIGGIEAKGFAYPFVFWGLAQAVQRRWLLVWPLLGIASTFHTLVGGWAVIACMVAWWMRKKTDQLSWIELACGLAVGGVLALPGLIPALALTAQASAEELREASLTYTFRRLSHHLVPYRFHLTRWCSFGALLVAWWWARRQAPSTQRMARLYAIATGSLAIAAGGLAIDICCGLLPVWRASLLRYYWFRLSDTLVPASTAIALVAVWLTPSTAETRLRIRWMAAAATLGVGLTVFSHGPAARAYSLQQQRWQVFSRQISPRTVDEAWRDVCLWIRDPANTPPDSLFLTPTLQQTFKWYAHRPDFVTWKDVPQDAAALGLWWKRRQAAFKLVYWPWEEPDKLAAILVEHPITHVVWPDPKRRALPDGVTELYYNDMFRVLRFDDPPTVPFVGQP